MGFADTWKKYFNNHAESSDNHWDGKLRTHYFKTTKDRAFVTVENYFKNRKGCTINSTSKTHGEIIIDYKGKRRAFVVVTIIMVRPFRTAVDFSITTEGGMFDLGFSHNLIETFFNELKSDMELIDTKAEQIY